MGSVGAIVGVEVGFSVGGVFCGATVTVGVKVGVAVGEAIILLVGVSVTGLMEGDESVGECFPDLRLQPTSEKSKRNEMNDEQIFFIYGLIPSWNSSFRGL